MKNLFIIIYYQSLENFNMNYQDIVILEFVGYLLLDHMIYFILMTLLVYILIFNLRNFI